MPQNDAKVMIALYTNNPNNTDFERIIAYRSFLYKIKILNTKPYGCIFMIKANNCYCRLYSRI